MANTVDTTPLRNTAHSLPVMEAFYTIQGEGNYSGQAAYFIRLAGCDVGCVWCDVKESWEVDPGQWQPIDAIVTEAAKNPARLAVITGGEPCIYDLTELITALQGRGFKVNIETSGAYELKGPADWICVSPKKFKSPLPGMLKVADELKVVVYNSSDLEWAVANASQTRANCMLFLQSEYSKSNKMLPLIVDFVKENPRWRISLQTHKYLGIP